MKTWYYYDNDTLKETDSIKESVELDDGSYEIDLGCGDTVVAYLSKKEAVEARIDELETEKNFHESEILFIESEVRTLSKELDNV